VLVDPTWNEAAGYNPDYKKVLVDLYSPCASAQLQQISSEEGIEVLSKTLKHLALTKVDESEKSYPYANDDDYGQNVYLISNLDASKCWYGFSYLRNDSNYPIKEIAKPELDGLEIVGKTEPFVNEAGAGADDITILRRVKGDCSYRIPTSLVPRQMTEAEIITKTKAEEASKLGDEMTYQMKWHSSGVCVYFMSQAEVAYSVTCKFPKFENFKIKGMPEDAREVSFTLMPGQCSVFFLERLTTD